MTDRRTTLSEKIVLSSREEVDRLCREFDCSEAELLHAVWKAGPDAHSVRAFLNRRLARLESAWDQLDGLGHGAMLLAAADKQLLTEISGVLDALAGNA